MPPGKNSDLEQKLDQFVKGTKPESGLATSLENLTELGQARE